MIEVNITGIGAVLLVLALLADLVINVVSLVFSLWKKLHDRKLR